MIPYLPFPRKPKTLPTVISPDEAEAVHVKGYAALRVGDPKLGSDDLGHFQSALRRFAPASW
jgi:hypothetical protein